MFELSAAIQAILQGEIIAYPTEAVYGLGCDPNNKTAVLRLLALKNRPIEKGLILIAADWEQLLPFVAPVPEAALQRALATWPGPVTWVFPASASTPKWIRGAHSSIAVRVTAHPLANALCKAIGHPLVSTSANIATFPPALTTDAVKRMFPQGLAVIVEGELGGQGKPTEIRDVITGDVVRPG